MKSDNNFLKAKGGKEERKINKKVSAVRRWERQRGVGGGAKEAKVKRGDEHKVLRWQGGDFIWRRLSSMGECDTYKRGGGVWWWGDKLWWWEYKESVMNYILQEFRDLVLCGLFQKVPPWLERSEKELFLDFGWNLHGELGSCWTGKAEVTTWGEFRSIQQTRQYFIMDATLNC